jgi:hypothetical protein
MILFLTILNASPAWGQKAAHRQPSVDAVKNVKERESNSKDDRVEVPDSKGMATEATIYAGIMDRLYRLIQKQNNLRPINMIKIPDSSE